MEYIYRNNWGEQPQLTGRALEKSVISVEILLVAYGFKVFLKLLLVLMAVYTGTDGIFGISP